MTLAHEFLLLSLDDDSGSTLINNGLLFQACISAAWLGEMMFQDRLVAAEADQFALRPGPLSPGLLGKVEAALEGRKPAKLDTCIQNLWGTWQGNNLDGWVKDDLVEQGVLRAEPNKLWFITYSYRHPTSDLGTETSIRQRLRTHVQTATDLDPPHRDDALLSLVRASGLLTQVWSEVEIEQLRPKIVERTKRAPLGRDAKTLADIQAAVLLTTVIT